MRGTDFAFILPSQPPNPQTTIGEALSSGKSDPIAVNTWLNQLGDQNRQSKQERNKKGRHSKKSKSSSKVNTTTANKNSAEVPTVPEPTHPTETRGCLTTIPATPTQAASATSLSKGYFCVSKSSRNNSPKRKRNATTLEKASQSPPLPPHQLHTSADQVLATKHVGRLRSFSGTCLPGAGGGRNKAQRAGSFTTSGNFNAMDSPCLSSSDSSLRLRTMSLRRASSSSTPAPAPLAQSFTCGLPHHHPHSLHHHHQQQLPHYSSYHFLNHQPLHHPHQEHHYLQEDLTPAPALHGSLPAEPNFMVIAGHEHWGRTTQRTIGELFQLPDPSPEAESVANAFESYLSSNSQGCVNSGEPFLSRSSAESSRQSSFDTPPASFGSPLSSSLDMRALETNMGRAKGRSPLSSSLDMRALETNMGRVSIDKDIIFDPESIDKDINFDPETFLEQADSSEEMRDLEAINLSFFGPEDQ